MDGIALEPDEEFTLRVEGINPLGMEIIDGGTFGMFVSSEIRVVIQDLESKKCFGGSYNYKIINFNTFTILELQLITQQ